MPEGPSSRFETLLRRLQNLPEEERRRVLDEEQVDGELRRDLERSLLEPTRADSHPALTPTAALAWQALADGQAVTPSAPGARSAGRRQERAPEADVAEAGGRAGVSDPESSGTFAISSRPEAIGPFRILDVLGEGGMGVVYLAEQTDPVERRLALKLMRSHLLGPGTQARFAAERQALARLSHPNIAQMYEAGTTEEGFPFFAMEHVPGLPITVYCDPHRLPIEERLRLFVSLCKGVHHAHQRGIIHRDLKPSNVLISDSEEQAIPKIIDFGIAKALDQPSSEATLIMGSQILGTLGYMSPESLVPGEGSRDPDIRTDVYALGILLYELLAGRRPFETTGLSPSAAMGKILAGEPPPPSARLMGASPADRQEAAGHRGTNPAALRRRIEGDLDAIVARAIARERDERYASVAELAADVERHLRHEPVEAMPPDLEDRLRKLVRRHRAGVAAALLALAALVVAMVGVAVGLVRARTAEAEARAQAERAMAAERQAQDEAASTREVADFLVQLFEVADPTRLRGNEITARELLDRGAERIGQELRDRPRVRARMLRTLGTVYGRLGLFEQAVALLEESLDSSLPILGPDHAEVAETRAALGQVYHQQGRLGEAESSLREAISTQERAAGARPEARVSTLRSLATVHMDRGEFDTARSLMEQSQELAEGVHGADSAEAAVGLWVLGNIDRYQGRQQEAEARFRAALVLQERVLGSGHPEVARTLSSLALVLNESDLEAAHEYNQRALEIYEQALGPGHPQVARVLSNIGYHLFRLGRPEEARGYLERAVAVDAAAGLHDHPYMASRLTNLGLVYWKLGLHSRAIPLFERANEIRQRRLTPDHPHRATSIWGLANVYRDLGRHREAEPRYREALRIRENALPPGDPELDDALREYAVFLRLVGREAEAEALESRRVSLPERD
ncbi:MAG: serine/threonine-protein kinase [Holophagales bacterium]|nr:serine/threonine-protein kinase [Holophagales bacterium]